MIRRPVFVLIISFLACSHLASDMAADIKRQLDEEEITDEDHPAMKAYQAMLSVSDQYRAQ